MHIIYLDKRIILENIVNDINLININENINYLKRNDGILIKGFLDLKCQYISLGIIRNFQEKIDINELILYENMCSNEIVMKLEDFDYFIKDKEIIFSFKMNIEGYKDVDKTFPNQTQEMEIVSNIDVNINELKEYIDEKKEIIVLDEFPLIEINEEKNDLLAINENEINEIDEFNNKEDKSINNDDISCHDIDNEGKSIDFNINGTINKNSSISFYDSLFKKEKKVKLFKYRVILENDTYEDIAKEYNINLFKLKEINNNINLKLGNIIKIPLKK